jgi:hypothetical protein
VSIDDRETALIWRIEAMENALADAGVYDVGSDGWDGAAGAEIHDKVYEPFPHNWDYNLGWCRVSWAMKLDDVGARRFDLDRDRLAAAYDEAEDIPPQIFARAIGKGWRFR